MQGLTRMLCSRVQDRIVDLTASRHPASEHPGYLNLDGPKVADSAGWGPTTRPALRVPAVLDNSMLLSKQEYPFNTRSAQEWGYLRVMAAHCLIVMSCSYRDRRRGSKPQARDRQAMIGDTKDQLGGSPFFQPGILALSFFGDLARYMHNDQPCTREGMRM